MKGRVKRNKVGNLIVKYKNFAGVHEVEINPRQIEKIKEGFLVDFEEIKINQLGRKVDPMNVKQNQSSCRWVANILQKYEDKGDEPLYSQIENAIISWSAGENKTAGFLTRKIMNIINKKNKKK